ncbi:DUF2207 domain-containing protein [Patescibacteria group bacterium]|nr:DUF2207 domain-containing protein [Patescibacteria group bacterium]
MKKLFFLFISIFFIFPSNAHARSYVTEWYVKDFNTDITVNTDASLDITEYIIADCGNLPDRHGIFRTLSTARYLEDNKITNPITLYSITDFDGNPYNYSTTTDSYYDTITWKIGDPDIVVTGENGYIIKYHVDNALINISPDFDELYWNIHGAFWDMEFDKFSAVVHFPEEITKSNTEIYNYSGEFGSKETNLVQYKWLDQNSLQYDSTSTLYKKTGITTSVTFPKGIVDSYTPPPPTWWEQNGAMILAIIFLALNILSFMIPLIALIICYVIWSRHGKDPNLGKTIIAEYEPPDRLNPMQINMLMSFGNLSTHSITASIINLAVKKYITINELEEKGLIFKSKDYKLIKNEDMTGQLNELDASEKLLYQSLFDSSKSVKISSLKNKFYKKITPIKDRVKAELMQKKIFVQKGFDWQSIMLVIGILMAFSSFFFGFIIPFLGINLLASGIIVLVFSYFMSKMTTHGAELLWQTKGFRLFMETAEKYRQMFNEEEHLFEKLLPYAIAFKMVKQWIAKMKEIYGEEYMNNYHPYWYTGTAFATSFDIDSFSSNLTAMSSNMSSTMSSSPSSSGSGGGGSSGGGGGGGGGGGW